MVSNLMANMCRFWRLTVSLIALKTTSLNAEAPLDSVAGIYNSSTIPTYLPWNTYNYCNASHVNAEHYGKPSSAPSAELVYLNVMIRHHKRTPDNLYPDESQFNLASGWDCSNFLQESYAAGTSARVYHETNIPSWHPFLKQIWNGSCDLGQLTADGLEDAVAHGKDFWGVYHGMLGFLPSVDTQYLLVRASTEPRTHQTAGGILYGMDPSTADVLFPVVTQPEGIDSLPPRYPCKAANNIRNTYQSVPAWTDHLRANSDLQQRLNMILGTTGIEAWNSWYDHFFDTFNSRTCHGHPLPCNASGACVLEEDADRVRAIGDFEYNYIWNAAQNSTIYNRLTFGVMFQELAMNFKAFKAGEANHKVAFYVGHDGSMIRLASGLGFGKLAPLRWPAMGSEIVMEVWKVQGQGDPETQANLFVRVLYEGTVVSGYEWIPLPEFIRVLEGNVPEDIFAACEAS